MLTSMDGPAFEQTLAAAQEDAVDVAGDATLDLTATPRWIESWSPPPLLTTHFLC